MKKTILSIVAVASLLLSACSMDEKPVGSLIDTEALQTRDDCERFRNGFYMMLAGLTTGGYVSYPEIQMDNFYGTIINGNRLGPINAGVIQSSDGDFASVWGGLYGCIADVNFFLEYAVPLAESEDLDEDAIRDIKRYVAEAKAVRAYLYFRLLDFFCPRNIPEYAEYGLPIVTKYNPTANKATYPSRSSQEKTYAFIHKDLQDAYDGLKEYEEYSTADVIPMSPYINSWTVLALESRLALLEGNYEKALNLSKEVIESNVYTLSTRNGYPSMWSIDENNEIIFRPIATATNLVISSTGSAWISASEYQADYIPSPYVAVTGPDNLYTRADIRYSSFIGQRDLAVEGALVKVPAFVKYPGNVNLRQVSSTNNLVNMPKVFRLSENYLIIAESACELGEEGIANQYLTKIRENRISNYTATTYAGEELRKEIRKERLRELIGEGFRMSDLRRWGEGFTRDQPTYVNYPSAAGVVTMASTTVVYQVNDYRYTWPIPATEIQVNPHMVGQQNPQYN